MYNDRQFLSYVLSVAGGDRVYFTSKLFINEWNKKTKLEILSNHSKYSSAVQDTVQEFIEFLFFFLEAGKFVFRFNKVLWYLINKEFYKFSLICEKSPQMFLL